MGTKLLDPVLDRVDEACKSTKIPDFKGNVGIVVGADDLMAGLDLAVLKLKRPFGPDEPEKLRGALLTVPQDARPSLSEGNYYVSDLVGMAVFSDAGEALGEAGQVGGDHILGVRHLPLHGGLNRVEPVRLLHAQRHLLLVHGLPPIRVEARSYRTGGTESL